MYLNRYICNVRAMPNIDSLAGIKINVYSGDHLPPHIHAVYNEYEVLLIIKTKAILCRPFTEGSIAEGKNMA